MWKHVNLHEATATCENTLTYMKLEQYVKTR